MNTRKAIILARKHCDEGAMASSARLCLERAIRAHDDDRLDDAIGWAAKSLAYSIGINGGDYVRVTGGKHWSDLATSKDGAR